MSSDNSLSTPYGAMRNDRSLAPLAEICQKRGGIQTGPFGSQLHSSDYVEEGTPIITVEHLGENTINGENAPRVSEEDLARLAKFLMSPGDIVFSRVGSVDKRGLVTKNEEGWLFSGRLLRVRPNPDCVDPAYLSYFFGLPKFKDYIRSIAVGATMPSLNTRLLAELPIVLAPLPQQRYIGKALLNLDLKIRLNEEISSTLESIAQTLFRSWFVDFDPVRAKMAGEKPVGMDDATAALFPESMEESELGEIPAGWAPIPLGDIAVPTLGGLWGNDEPGVDALDSYFCLRGVDMDDLKSRGYADRTPVRWDKPEKVEKRRLENHHVLVAASGAGPVGKSLLWDEVMNDLFPGPVVFSNFVKRFESPDQYHATFVSQIMSHIYATGEIFEFVNGTSVPNLQDKELLRAKHVALPPVELLRTFDSIVRSGLLRRFSGENRTLTIIRDSLLPRLISGELRVPEDLVA